MRALRFARPWIGAAVLAAAALAPARAEAVDVELQASTALQAYEVVGGWGDFILQRRRLTQTVGLGLYNLQGKYRPGQADYRLVLQMRLDADFGVNAHLPDNQASGETTYTTPAGNGVRFVPGLYEAPVDVMYGYVEGRNLARGWLGFKVGRQYVTDVLGWWSFDGGLVRVTTPWYVQAEAYGGFEQRGGLPLSTSRFERQGVWRGSQRDFGAGTGKPSVTTYPSFQDASLAPAFGVALESAGPSFLHGRLSYRRVYNTGTTITGQFPDPGGGYRTITGRRLSQERIGWAGSANKADLGGLRGGFTYDLYNQIVGSAYGALEAYLGRSVIAGADFDYVVPTFDADSIWNWFARGPITTATGRVSIVASSRAAVSASGGVRLWTTDGDPDTFGDDECEAAGFEAGCSGAVGLDPSVDPVRRVARGEEARATVTTADAIGNLDARVRFGSGDVALRGMIQTGARGSREGADLSGEKRFDGGRYSLGSRVSLYGWRDPTRSDRDAVSFGYVIAGGFRPYRVADLRLEWEHDMNRLVGHRFRVVGLINVLVLR